MMYYRRNAVLALGIGLLSACATGGFRNVSLTAGDESEPTVSLAGHSLYIVPNTKMTDTALEARIRAHLEDALLGQGYTVASPADAELYVLASFGAVERMTLTKASIVAPAATYVTRGANGAVIRNRSPEHMEHPDVPAMQHTLAILVSASDAKYYRETGMVKTLWQGEASTPGNADQLHEVVPYLVTSALKYFGKSSGGTLSMDIRDAEIRSWLASR